MAVGRGRLRLIPMVGAGFPAGASVCLIAGRLGHGTVASPGGAVRKNERANEGERQIPHPVRACRASILQGGAGWRLSISTLLFSTFQVLDLRNVVSIELIGCIVESKGDGVHRFARRELTSAGAR
jgi:hypothetical protein